MRLLHVGWAAAVVALVAACGSASGDTTTTTPADVGDGEVRAIPARVVAEDISSGEPWTTSRLTTLREPVVPLAEDLDACADDANPHTVVIAISHDDLPEGGFSIWVDGDDPPPGVADGITFFAPGELDPGDLASGEFEALGADGELAVGETKIAYDVTTHCGLNRMFRDVDGRAWVLNDDDASPENLDYVPEEWRGVVTGEAIDLQIERAEEDVLLVTAVGTEHTLRYEPAADEVGCD